MARRFTIELIMDLAKSLGGNPSKYMGTRTNVNFLGKGPTKNPLFQQHLDFIGPQGRGITAESLPTQEALASSVNDAMAYLTAGKLNPIQTEMLGNNLLGIKNILHPPVLPSATVTDIAPGIEGLRRFPKETHKFFGRPLKGKDFDDIDKLMKEGYTDSRGRRWDFGAKAPNRDPGERLYNKITGLDKPRLVRDQGWNFRSNIRKERRRLKELEQSRPPETGPGAFNAALNQKTGMSRAIARNLLLKDTRLKLKPEELFMLREGKGEPLDLMVKYYGRSMSAYDEFLNSVNLEAARPDEFAEMILKNVELILAFAHGGLARILEV